MIQYLLLVHSCDGRWCLDVAYLLLINLTALPLQRRIRLQTPALLARGEALDHLARSKRYEEPLSRRCL